jgi:hypothetical protein
MFVTVSAEHPKNTNGTTDHTESTSSETFQRELDQLAQRWQAHDRDDLALRHETGALLNRCYGDPTGRQPRGKGVLKGASERLGKTEAELSQLRRFAHHFPSLQAFRQENPAVTNWTQARNLLPRRPQGDGGRRPSTRKASAGRLRPVTRPLATLTSAFRKLGNELSEKEKGQLLARLKEFVKAVPDCLKIRLVID